MSGTISSGGWSGPRHPALWVSWFREDNSAETHPGDQTHRGGIQVRRHCERHGRAKHRQDADRPDSSDPERGSDGWDAEWM